MSTTLELNKQLRQIKKINRVKRKTAKIIVIGVGTHGIIARLDSDMIHINRFPSTDIDLNPLRGEAERMSKIMMFDKRPEMPKISINPQREIDRKYRYKYAQNRKK